ncbi:hypothetical protein SSS_02436 [Sarcoptes scabiei]|uniref:MARVEL domain-containing protein n=1 Tax=Sarcoptes scabiei TaxID=52283 RepID=A0A834VF41_SARSC|nr:hypothetical protein SSS_02436 [Sarcoptes scabiei]
MPSNLIGSLSSYIVINRQYIRSPLGLLKYTECLIGFISFICIWIACRRNYDPYSQTNDGFVGGDLETFALLIFSQTFTTTLMLGIVYSFSIITSTIIPKTIFEFVFNLIVSLQLFIISLLMFIIVIDRNKNLSDDFFVNGNPNEPGFAYKITSSIFGFMNSILYSIDAYVSYQSYIS